MFMQSKLSEEYQKWTESSACVYVWSVCLDVPEVFMKW